MNFSKSGLSGFRITDLTSGKVKVPLYYSDRPSLTRRRQQRHYLLSPLAIGKEAEEVLPVALGD
jgi:hypothetical protein